MFPWLLQSCTFNISFYKPFFYILSWSHHKIINNTVDFFFNAYVAFATNSSRFSFCKVNSLYGWSSLCKEFCFYISSMLFFRSFCKFTTKVYLDWNSPTLAVVSSTLILSSNLHCIYAFVHNHHPIIDNVAKFFSNFSSTSSSTTTASPWRYVNLTWLSSHCFWRAIPLNSPSLQVCHIS